MSTDNINKWLSLGANIGVLVGLVLLVFELRQNSELIQVQIHQLRSDQHVSNRFQRADSEFLLPALDKFEAAGGFEDPSVLDQLTDIEVARIKELLFAFHQDYDNLFYQYQQGFLDEEFYRYRVEVPITVFAPLWQKLNVFESYGRRPSFDAEIKRITADSR